jgi:UDP:flavonoid glycosyltransferase YjiC (YdhE family)
MLTIACDLRDRGYRILFNTGEVFQAQIEAEGLEFIPLTGKANFDYRTFNKFLPEGQTLEPGPEEMMHNIKHVFADTMLDQYLGMRAILGREPVDLILADFIFAGILPMLSGPRTNRPPIVSIGVSPMVLSSIDVSPLSGPGTIGEARVRNREETARFQAGLAPATEYLDNILCRYGYPPLPGFFLDCLYTLPDLFLELTADTFEFPRSDMPSHIKFVGSVLPGPSSDLRMPDWWKELDDSRPLALVTQGTIANKDLNELIGPTLVGLSAENVLVIAATGKPVHGLTAPIPMNAQVTPFISFTKVLPKVGVFITNGGFGAVNQALSMGVPIVIAGETEDKSFVAARVAWSGAGINLSTNRPGPEQVRDAVCEVLRDGRYRDNARRLQKDFAQYDALGRIAGYIERLGRSGFRPSHVQKAGADLLR